MIRNLDKVALKSYLKRKGFKAYRFSEFEKLYDSALGFFFVGELLVVYDAEGIEIRNRKGKGDRGGFYLRAGYNELRIAGGCLKGPGFVMRITD